MKTLIHFFFFSLCLSSVLLAQPGKNLCFQSEWADEGYRFNLRGFNWHIHFINEHNNLDMTREEISEKIRITLDRLPTSHLRIINSKHIVIGRPCKGGGSRKCAEDPTRGAIMLSYESFRDIRARPTRYTCSGRTYRDKGSWDDQKQTHGTLLHEIGHFIDYEYSITNGLPRHERDDFRTCVNTDGCYSRTAKTRGINEVTAQAYYLYFDRITYTEVLAGSSDGVPRHGARPRLNNHRNKVLNERRLNVLLSSGAWEDWD